LRRLLLRRLLCSGAGDSTALDGRFLPWSRREKVHKDAPLVHNEKNVKLLRSRGKLAAKQMAKKPQIAERHRRTRNDHAQETAEDYVEAISDLQRELGRCRVMDLARRFDVSHVAVSKVVARLKRENLVVSEPYAPLELTKRGRQLAAHSRRRHETVFRFLRAIGVSEQTAAIDTEGIEHHVSRQTLDCFQRITEQLKRSGSNDR